jgi:ppGpp synthetase/RelA/SpoT-type nucleotidyltranferase
MLGAAMSETLLQAFDDRSAALATLGARLQRELEVLLAGAQVPVQFVSWRLKSRQSLARKLARPDKTYLQLWDVTDLVGLRVATHFDDHVGQIARLVERHFQVDLAHSADHTKPAGYRSVHYVCALPDAPHPDFRFELQLRTVLQHAWAEVEHDLGYKVDDAVPEQIRRRFARVAAVLEIADQEFVSIRRELAASREEARATLERSGALPVDLVSLDALVQRPEVVALDGEVASALGVPVSAEPFSPGYLVKLLRLAGLETTREVSAALVQHGPQVRPTLERYFAFAKSSLGLSRESVTRVERGYALLFVALLHVLRSDALALEKVTRLGRLFLETDFPGDPRRAQLVAGALVGAWS